MRILFTMYIFCFYDFASVLYIAHYWRDYREGCGFFPVGYREVIGFLHASWVGGGWWGVVASYCEGYLWMRVVGSIGEGWF